MSRPPEVRALARRTALRVLSRSVPLGGVAGFAVNLLLGLLFFRGWAVALPFALLGMVAGVLLGAAEGWFRYQEALRRGGGERL